MTHAALALIGIGFLVGFRHAFEPDHLAAVSTLASRHGWRTASRLGVAWGCGHTASVGLIGMTISLLGVRVPATFFRVAELGVACLLVALGVSTLVVEARRHRRQQGAAHHVAHAHRHPHSHSHANLRTAQSAFAFGIAHGLAGGGAVMVLIVAAASSASEQLLYLLVFGVGTILGMSIVSLFTGAVAGLASARSQRIGLSIRLGAACASMAAGVWLGAGVLAGG